MKIDISGKQQLTIEIFINKAKGGQSFTGTRFRLGKRKPVTLFHFHHSKALAIVDALQACIAEISEARGSFFESPAWQKLRYETLKKYRQCCLCGSTDTLHVDHIRPRSKYPELALSPDNLQVLCSQCNLAKRNGDCVDYRK
jgi:5-methylcytosine-specific restriction endonuclease McrA